MIRGKGKTCDLHGVTVPLAPSGLYPHGEVSVGEMNGTIVSVLVASDSDVVVRREAVEAQTALESYRSMGGAIFVPIVVPNVEDGDEVDAAESSYGVAGRKRRRNVERDVDGDRRAGFLERALDSAYGLVERVTQRVLGGGAATPLDTSDAGRDGGGDDVAERREDEALRRAGPVVDVAWHPQVQRVAVALRDGTVRFYDMETGEWWPDGLVHEFQRSIRSVRWCPVGGSPLAVVVPSGVCLWRPVVAGRRRSYWMTWLQHDLQPSVAAAEFSPCGRFLAASGGSRLVVYDVAKGAEGATAIFVPGGAAGPLRWSPTGDHLVTSARTSDEFRLWETRGWTSSSWSAGRPLQDACWSPSGETLLYSACGSTAVHVLVLQRGVSSLRVRVKLEVGPSSAPQGSGGPVRALAWSPTGERLAVTFRGDGPACELVAVFGVEQSLSPSFHPIGFIRGPPNPSSPETPNRPKRVQFRPHFDQGALLMVSWECGQISLYPMYFASHGGAAAAREHARR